MCVWVCFVSEMAGVISISSLLPGETQEDKVVGLKH